MKEEIPDTLSPCDVFCGACPAYKVSCFGCYSQNKAQKRISKWKCRIRTCALEQKGVDFCVYCDDFPCKMLSTFSEARKDDQRYKYRTEIIQNLRELKKSGIKDHIIDQEEKWRCPECGGTIAFYYYRCKDCGFKKSV